MTGQRVARSVGHAGAGYDWLFGWDLEFQHVCLTRGRTLFLLKFSLRDDDDEFLYGDSQPKVPADLALNAPAVPSSSAGENASSSSAPVSSRDAFCTLLVLKTKYKFKHVFGLLVAFYALRARRQPQPRLQSQQSRRQLNRMSEFSSANLSFFYFCQPKRAHPSHSLFVFSIPFGKAVPVDDDLFPPIRPPPPPPAADVTAPQASLTDDTEEGEDATADADADADLDADAAMGDGSDASEESDEVSSSVQK